MMKKKASDIKVGDIIPVIKHGVVLDNSRVVASVEKFSIPDIADGIEINFTDGRTRVFTVAANVIVC